MHPMGFEPAILSSERPQSHALDRAATGVGLPHNTEGNMLCGGADKSLDRPGRKQATATDDFDFHISYL
jgi:hypothetical protein